MCSGLPKPWCNLSSYIFSKGPPFRESPVPYCPPGRSLCIRTGGPLKPGFGLSGIVPPLDKVFRPLVRVFVPTFVGPSLRRMNIPTQAKTGLEWATRRSCAPGYCRDIRCQLGT